MKYYLRLTITLLLFCAVASGILAYVNSLTAPLIAERKAAEEILTREKLIPGASFVEHKAIADTTFTYFVATKDSVIAGYTFTAIGSGYAGPVKTMVALDKDFKVITIQVTDQAETPGLGANCTAEDFPKRFQGRALAELVVDKDSGPEGIKSLTGATITTRCIANSIRDAVLLLKADLEAAQGESI